MHPALKAVQARAGVELQSDADWVCGTPHLMRAIAKMQEGPRRIGDRQVIPVPRLMIALGLLVASLFFASLVIGPAGLGLGDSLRALFHRAGRRAGACDAGNPPAARCFWG